MELRPLCCYYFFFSKKKIDGINGEVFRNPFFLDRWTTHIKHSFENKA